MDSLRLFIRCALFPRTIGRAVTVASVITPILTAINHWGEFAKGQIGPGLVLQVALTFCVPYCVSTYSSAQAEMGHTRPKP
jgi:hypothetical protein